MTTETQTLQSIRVLPERLAEAWKTLEKLARKARRYGNPDIQVVLGPAEVETRVRVGEDGRRHEVKITWATLLVQGEAPRVGQHEFLARVELSPEGCIVDTVPGVQDLDARFRTTDGYCEHCRTRRARKDVYVVRDLVSGAQQQVGRDCLRDFLGIDDPARIAQRFAFWRDAADLEAGCRAHLGMAYAAEEALSIGATCIRLFGWCSKGQAGNDPSLTPTVSHVWVTLNPRPRDEREERELRAKVLAAHCDADLETARETLRWVREEMRDDSDYTHNLKVVLGGESIRDERRLGLAISAVAAFHRAQERELRLTKDRAQAARSEHVGAEGERLRGLTVVLQSQRIVGSNEWGDTVLAKFVDDAGNVLTWFTGKGTGLRDGERCVLDGTVKAHSEYNGAKETLLTRCKVQAA